MAHAAVVLPFALKTEADPHRFCAAGNRRSPSESAVHVSVGTVGSGEVKTGPHTALRTILAVLHYLRERTEDSVHPRLINAAPSTISVPPHLFGTGRQES